MESVDTQRKIVQADYDTVHVRMERKIFNIIVMFDLKIYSSLSVKESGQANFGNRVSKFTYDSCVSKIQKIRYYGMRIIGKLQADYSYIIKCFSVCVSFAVHPDIMGMDHGTSTRQTMVTRIYREKWATGRDKECYYQDIVGCGPLILKDIEFEASDSLA